MAKKAPAKKTESKVDFKALFAEYMELNAQKKEIEKKLDKVKDLVKSTLPDENGASMTAGEYQAVLTVSSQERLAGRDEFFAVFGEKVVRDKGLIKEQTLRTVTISRLSDIKDAFKKKGE